MADSANFDAIPRGVDIAALYYNGLYAVTPSKAAAAFPPARKVTLWIDVIGDAPERCQILDVERFDASPSTAPGWIRARAAAVHTSLPTVYCDRSDYPLVVRACAIGGLMAGKHYQLWISTLDGTQVMNGVHLSAVPGVVACQDIGGGGHTFDSSVVYNDRWHPLAA